MLARFFLRQIAWLALAGFAATAEAQSAEPNTTTAADSVATFNEVMYHPAGDETEGEWVELHNQMSVNLDISGWRIEGEINFQFPTNTVFAGGGYLVVAANPVRLQAQTGLTNLFGPFFGRLANAAGTLVLRNQSGRLMDEISYTDEDPWPVGADGSDASLSKLGRFDASSPAANWRASAIPGGTPGRANFVPASPGEVPPAMLANALSASRWIVPQGEMDPAWAALNFNDLAWAVGTGALGYDSGTLAPEPQTPPVDLPQRVYAFEGDLSDGSGAENHGESAGAAFSTDVPSGLNSAQSLLLGGSSYVRMADGIDPEAYTIALWVKPENLQSSSVVVRTDSSGPLSSWSHQLRISGAGKFEHYIFDGTGRAVAATNVLTPGVWRHVAITAASDGEMKIFVDGVPSGAPRSIGRLWALGTEWRVGGNAGNAASYFNGRVDDLAIWHKVLPEESIRALAKGLSPGQLNGYSRYFNTDVQAPMFKQNSTLLARIPFESWTRAAYDELTLRVRNADGFVAFLNGAEVARRNAPAALAWNSSAVTNRADAHALALETIDLSAHRQRILTGKNVLAVQALNSSSNDPVFLFSAELLARTAPIALTTNVAFSEISGAGSARFFVELQQSGAGTISLEGWQIASSAGGSLVLSTNIGPGGFLALSVAQLGFPINDGERLFLLGRAGELIDAVEIHNRSRSRLEATASARWYFTSSETPAAANVVNLRAEVVINEIMYHHAPAYRTKLTPYEENDEQWIELHNASDRVMDLMGWRLDGELSFAFPPGTSIQPQGYLVVANNAAALRDKHPGAEVIGNFSQHLSHHSGRIVLVDSADNPADEMRYHNSHPWPEHANGGGSSLELRDPGADNTSASSWGASDESSKAGWKRYVSKAKAVQPVYSPSIFSFHEFRIGLLDEGEALIDNITVTELPAGGTARQLLQNTAFDNGTTAWRLLGNHSHSTASDGVLRLVATGSTSYLDNRLETTLKSGGTIVPVVTGREYEIAFDAKWVAGSPQVRTELYYNKVAATTILEMPASAGTPGRRNSIYEANMGPTYGGLSHTPVAPKATEAIQVSVSASDPDGVAAVRLAYSVNGGTWRELAMTATRGNYLGSIPAQANGAVIQFYVLGTDGLGAITTFPARGRNSRALIKVDSERIVAGKQTFRTIMTPAESTLLHSSINMMSDDLLGCTVVHQEKEVFYDAKIRLHGSMFSRSQPSLTGMTIKFPADHRFRGSRESVIVRRRGLVETFAKHVLNSAGGLPGNYDDVVHLVSHRSDNMGTARLNLANYDDTYIDSQFEGDNDGTVFKLEGIREYQTTQSGNPEGLKLSQPIGWIIGFDIANLGDDPEQYRWGIMIQSQRRRDDYSRIVAMGKAFSFSGASLKQAASAAIDVDEWARLFALQSLLGIGDVYGVDNPHNFAFYVRPSDGRVVGLQNDWEFAFGAPTSASIYGNKNVYKMLRVPGIQRIYQGHLLDLVENVVNSSYFTPWTRHYSTMTGESYTSLASYAAARATSVRGQLAARIPFEITANNGLPYQVNTASVVLQGRGWIDVHKIFKAGETAPLTVTWLDDQRWQATLPLAAGTNEIILEARNFRGAVVGQDSIAVTTTLSDFPQRDHLRISEVMYHPADPSVAEINAGFLDEDDFEFVELVNLGAERVSLSGVKFTVGITFDFSQGSVGGLESGERVLVVRNRAAFELRYGTNRSVAGVYGGSLSNGGEQLKLVDGAGATILDFAFGDGGSWPDSADGSGRSLVVKDAEGDYSDPFNWRASLRIGGSPGLSEALPTLHAAISPAGSVQIGFEAQPQTRYLIYGCDDLAIRDWKLIDEYPAAENSRLEVWEAAAAGNHRFFRIETR